MTELKDIIQQRHAIDMLLMIMENPNKPISWYCENGQSRTKHLRIIEWADNGYVVWNEETLQHNTHYCKLTPKGLKTAYKIKLLLLEDEL